MEHVAANAPHASGQMLVPFALAARDLGLGVSGYFSNFGLSLEQLNQGEQRVATGLLEHMLRATAEFEGLRDIGLLAAEQVQPGHLDVIEYLARAQPTLWTAFERVQRYIGLLHESCHVELMMSGQRAVLEVSFAGPSHHALLEFVLAVHLIAARRIANDPCLTPLETHFSHPRPADTAVHQRVFRSPLYFNRHEAALVFARETLDTPLPMADSGLATVLERVAISAQQKLGRRSDLLEVTRELVRRQIRGGAIQAERVARRLGMSTRTLHRKLVLHGTTYRGVVDDMRREIALSSLRDPGLTTGEIATRLGFANVPAFHRAFRRWTGTTATGYRGMLLGQGNA